MHTDTDEMGRRALMNAWNESKRYMSTMHTLQIAEETIRITHDDDSSITYEHMAFVCFFIFFFHFSFEEYAQLDRKIVVYNMKCM